jgi:predicted dehydrogenase
LSAAAALTFEPVRANPLRVALVGCGDVAMRRYVPTLAALAPRVEVVSCCDARLERAEQAAASLRSEAVAIRASDRLDDLLAEPPDAVFNLTPAPEHAAVSEAVLAAGAHVYSEKPLAGSLPEADRLIELARSRHRLLMCAPAVAVAPLVRWLRTLVDAGRLGSPTLCTAFVGDLGPAAWREYTGDASVFYGKAVGPLVDMGVYALHAFVEVFGAIRRVQAMGGVAISHRVVRAGRHAGREFEAEGPDQLLVHLDFGGGCLGRLIASFAVPASRAPWLEFHLSRATITIPGETDRGVRGPVDIFVDDDSGLALSGWLRGLQPPEAAGEDSVIPIGARHFVASLLGEAQPELTAEKARHVVEACALAVESLVDGSAHELTTEP